jgi:hypothetical protein
MGTASCNATLFDERPLHAIHSPLIDNATTGRFPVSRALAARAVRP